MKKYKVCLVGIGAVGTEMIRLLKKHNFPMESLTILARSEREEVIDGDSYQVKVASPEAFEGMDFAFFAGTEGAKGASQTLGWEAVKRGCIVIDNGDDFRMDDRVPLVIPEINASALKNHQGFIANPNCSTIIALTPLAALHRKAKITRIIASTYQAVSGTGSSAIKELEDQVKAWAKGDPITTEVYPRQIAFNVLAQIGSEKEPGFPSEEIKMLRESRKIFGDDSIKVCSTCVRVPVFNGHAESINVEFEQPITPEEARALLEQAPGVRVVDNLKANEFPTPLDCSGVEEVLVGRIRKDPSCENGLALFVAGDNIWKGAALNAIQIAEALVAQND
jgi:aspartate-semialdehyde dehydrogenase